MTGKNVKTGFTMIELMIVVGMLLILAATLTSSISGARRRARIQACMTEAQEMTNAILAYENYAPNHEIDDTNGEEKRATKSNLGFILGDGENGMSGDKVPVLFEAANIAPNGDLLDPWHRPYYYVILKGVIAPKDKGRKNLGSSVLIPNFNRRLAREVEPENE